MDVTDFIILPVAILAIYVMILLAFVLVVRVSSKLRADPGYVATKLEQIPEEVRGYLKETLARLEKLGCEPAGCFELNTTTSADNVQLSFLATFFDIRNYIVGTAIVVHTEMGGEGESKSKKQDRFLNMHTYWPDRVRLSTMNANMVGVLPHDRFEIDLWLKGEQNVATILDTHTRVSNHLAKTKGNPELFSDSLTYLHEDHWRGINKFIQYGYIQPEPVNGWHHYTASGALRSVFWIAWPGVWIRKAQARRTTRRLIEEANRLLK